MKLIVNLRRNGATANRDLSSDAREALKQPTDYLRLDYLWRLGYNMTDVRIVDHPPAEPFRRTTRRDIQPTLPMEA